MACYHPNYILKSNYKVLNPETGEYSYVHKFLGSSDKYFEHLDEFKKIYKDYDLISVPCGNCIGCRLEYSRQWANRCMLEAKGYTDNYFVTLTYSEEFLTYNQKNNMSLPTLVRSDLTKFLKRLREYYSRVFNHTGVRFFASGEYGDKNARPHYHVLFFNLPINDLEYKFCRGGYKYYTSATLSKLWPKGIIIIGSLTWETCAYVARYVLKKRKGKSAEKYYNDLNIIPEYSVMSRKPGIGYDYYKIHKDDIYSTDSITDGFKFPIKPPKFFDKKFAIEDLDSFEKLNSLKEERLRFKENKERLKLYNTTLSLVEQLAVEENSKINISKQLVRGYESQILNNNLINLKE